ncbi:hypothetical protein SDJN03_20780, partial [Cucurbita argyrosperma subsp. sororia]
MDLFRNAKVVLLRSHTNKYLFADEDEESVTQSRNGWTKNARWSVEFVRFSDSIIRLKSCYGNYLTASNQRLFLGMTGMKVLQTRPERLDSSHEWEPIKERSLVRLKTQYGSFLRGNGGVPPWRNSVTHDAPHRTVTQEWILWNVEVIETEIQSSVHKTLAQPEPDLYSTSSSVSFESGRPSTSESTNSGALNTLPKPEGRRIFYQIADDDGRMKIRRGIFYQTADDEWRMKIQRGTL